MKTVLITGGSSYIGRGVILLLLSKSYRVISLINKSSNNDINDSNYMEYSYSLNGDDTLPMFNFSIDTICHIGAYIPPDMNDSSFAQECVNTNGIGTLKLLEYAKKNAIKNFIYITGSNTYRQSDISVDEKFPQYPVKRATYYLSSKVLGEFYVKHFEEIGSINSTILRISSIYGNLIKKDFITNSIIKLIKGEKVFIYNADYKADFVYIQDVIKIIFSCIENAITGTFNISSNKLFSIREIIDIILHFLKDKNELIEYSSAVKIDMGYFLVNNELAKNILGYAPTNMNEAIKEIIFKVKSTIR